MGEVFALVAEARRIKSTAEMIILTMSERELKHHISRFYEILRYRLDRPEVHTVDLCGCSSARVNTLSIANSSSAILSSKSTMAAESAPPTCAYRDQQSTQ